MNNDYKQIYDCFGDIESNLLKTKLESNGVGVVIEGQSRKIAYGIQAEKEEPHPQVVEALGLRITNCEPCRPSV